MYPNLYYFFQDAFGIRLNGLKFINSFGFFVALAFVAAAALLARELKRKSSQGLFHPTEIKHVVGKPAGISELLLNFALGFFLGYKIIALFFIGVSNIPDPQAYIFSSAGSLPTGLITGLAFLLLKWWEKRKELLAKPEERVVRIWPQDRVGEITFLALIIGLLGARLFDIFENWSDFLEHPAARIFSGGGLTFYGGLICSTIAIIIFARRHKINVRYLADAIAPSLMIAYAIGRIGCQVAGDGDWGIYNSAFKVDSQNAIVAASPADFEDTVRANSYYFHNIDSNLRHLDVPKPQALSFLPNWFFAYQYPHNVNRVGVQIAGCDDMFCARLPIPVFPTPLYETISCTFLFLILWGLRKRMKIGGTLFCLYLVLNGIERFLIEKIRVNNRLHILGMQPTQAEVISFFLIITGLLLWFFLRYKYRARI